MNRWILIVLPSIFLFGFGVAELNQTQVEIKYPSNWPKPNYDFETKPLTKEKIELGRKLFYDPILSANGMVSCASCHLSFTAFTHVDHALSHGINDSIGTRNSPVLINLAWNKLFMWDGAVNNIEVQALAPISHASEMGNDLVTLISNLNEHDIYPALFKNAFGEEKITSKQLLLAIAQFQLTLVSSNSKYDKVKVGEFKFTDQEANGYKLFQQNCNNCHTEPLFTNTEFENNGLQPDKILNDSGRYQVTRLRKDLFNFKVPTLRNIEYSFPYMHDGRYNNLNEVINHYRVKQDSQVLNHQNKPVIEITENEKVDIIAFLLTLSDKEFLFNPDYGFPRN